MGLRIKGRLVNYSPYIVIGLFGALLISFLVKQTFEFAVIQVPITIIAVGYVGACNWLLRQATYPNNAKAKIQKYKFSVWTILGFELMVGQITQDGLRNPGQQLTGYTKFAMLLGLVLAAISVSLIYVYKTIESEEQRPGK